MELTRRQMLAISGGAAAASVFALPAMAALEAEISALTGGADLGEGGVTLNAPEIAENGNTVPIEFSAPDATSVTLYADGNPVPNVATFKFGALSPTRSASTRIRLARTQNVVAVAQLGDGSWTMASAEVKVTIGGCGG